MRFTKLFAPAMVLASALFPRILCAQDRGSGAAQPAAAQAGARVPESPEHYLRSLFYRGDSALMERDGKEVVAKSGVSPESRAWYVEGGQPYGPALLSRLEVLETLRKEAPDSPWTLAARAQFTSDTEQAISLCEKAAAKDPREDILWLCTDGASTRVTTEADGDLLKAFLDRHRQVFEASADGLAAEASALLRASSAVSHVRYSNESAALYDRALKMDPNNIYALRGKFNDLLNRTQYPEAADLFTHASSPIESESLHMSYWYVLSMLTALGEAEQGKRIEEDGCWLVEQREPSTAVVQSLGYDLVEYPDRRAAILNLILKRYPRSSAAEMAMVQRSIGILGKDAEVDAAPTEAKQELAAKLIEFLQQSGRRSAAAEQSAAGYLLELSHSTDLSTEQLFIAAEATPAASAVSWMYTSGPALAVAAADRKTHLPELEKLALAQVEAAVRQSETISDLCPYETKSTNYALSLFWDALANWDDALGWIYLQEGRVNDAEEKLTTAEKLLDRPVGNQHRLIDYAPEALTHLGRLYTAKGDYTRAEEYLSRSLSTEYFLHDEHPAIAAYKGLYLQQHGTSDGLEDYMKVAYDKEAVRRKALILKERIADPKTMPPFKLVTIDGKTVNSQNLKGKVLVINFWGTWCGPCQLELPYLQKFYEKYDGNPNVVFLTIDHLDTLDAVKKFMAEKKYSFPVLREEGDYVEHAGVTGFPTTWFVDRDGKEVFSKSGASRRLLDEFSWRVESMLQPPGTAKSDSGNSQ